MAPSATDPPAQTKETEVTYPTAQLFPPKEAHFESFIETRPDGYQKAKSRGPGKAAIVIDNGIHSSLRQCFGGPH